MPKRVIQNNEIEVVDDKSKKKKNPPNKGVNNQIDLEPQLKEAILTPMQRRHRAIVMKRHMPKIIAARKRARKRVAGGDKLRKRANKHATNAMRAKVAGQKGKNYNQLSPSEKSAIDKRVQAKRGALKRIAKRMLPVLRRKEASKFSKKHESYDISFETFLLESFKTTPKKRPHELFTKKGTVKADKRFKINRKVQKEEIEDLHAVYSLALNEDLSGKALVAALKRIKAKQIDSFAAAALGALRDAVTGDTKDRMSVGGHAFNVARNFKGVNSRELEKNYRAIYEEHGAGEEGTDKIIKKYIKDTPGQKILKKFTIDEEFENLFEDTVTLKQMKAFEKFVDRLFKKFDIDFEFTKHFADRMNDDRNDPDIKMQELADFVKKILKAKGENLKAVAGNEAVMKDLHADLNIPVVVKFDKKNQEFDVVAKTIMRKKNFTTTNKVIKFK
ncbi:MAG: hypothetical protein COA84_13420 [Robiginitomaculum sp.]|nr:MAG: hypothetical protein COA84_13420 [Robiginitomaculum sp.]